MVESTPKSSVMTADEKAAARARQEAIFASAKQEVAQEKAEKERKFQEILQARTSPIYVNIHDAVTKAYQEVEDDFDTPLQEREKVVTNLYSERDELVPTIPDINNYMPENFASIVFEHRVPDTIVSRGEYLAVERSGFHLRAAVQKENDSFRVELLDLEEGELTRKRLSGVLFPGTGEAVGRMTFVDNPDVFIHPSVAQQKDTSLRELFTLIEEERILDVSYP